MLWQYIGRAARFEGSDRRGRNRVSVRHVDCVHAAIGAALATDFWTNLSMVWLVLFAGGSVMPTATGLLISSVDVDCRWGEGGGVDLCWLCFACLIDWFGIDLFVHH